MIKKKFVLEESFESVSRFIGEIGATDVSYLQAHWGRFLHTREFVSESVDLQNAPLQVLDIGAHWLHQAFLYANLGHIVTCVDVPDTLQMRSVIDLADAIGARLISETRMEKASALDQIDESSIDVVLFCEIIEHITFNPITFWKKVYRTLKPGGRIIITTPNAFYGPKLTAAYNGMVNGRGLGIPLHEIFQEGTYGHHWKEYSLVELKDYFAALSDDFAIGRVQYVTRPGERFDVPFLSPDVQAEVNVHAHNIYLEVVLSEKRRGIEIAPPWEPV